MILRRTLIRCVQAGRCPTAKTRRSSGSGTAGWQSPTAGADRGVRSALARGRRRTATTDMERERAVLQPCAQCREAWCGGVGLERHSTRCPTRLERGIPALAGADGAAPGAIFPGRGGKRDVIDRCLLPVAASRAWMFLLVEGRLLPRFLAILVADIHVARASAEGAQDIMMHTCPPTAPTAVYLMQPPVPRVQEPGCSRTSMTARRAPRSRRRAPVAGWSGSAG